MNQPTDKRARAILRSDFLTMLDEVEATLKVPRPDGFQKRSCIIALQVEHDGGGAWDSDCVWEIEQAEIDMLREALNASRSADRSQEGYPGIAHDFETMRSALVQIRDECFNGHAHDIAEAALNAAPQAAETQLKGTAVNLPELRDRLDSSGPSGAAEHRDGAETPKKRLIADQAVVSRPAVAAPNSSVEPLNGDGCLRIYNEAFSVAVAEKPDAKHQEYVKTALVHVYAAGQRSVAPNSATSPSNVLARIQPDVRKIQDTEALAVLGEIMAYVTTDQRIRELIEKRIANRAEGRDA